MFPGDPDFTLERYGSLPYEYVILAIENGMKLMREDLLIYERPIAQNTAVIANQNVDRRKQRKPFSYEDFAFYMTKDQKDLPDSGYATAALILIKEKRFPSWALFCYKDLIANAEEGRNIEEPAFIANDAILLHPIKVSGGWKGMLIALESASDKKRVFQDSNGKNYNLLVPYINTKVVANEGVTLTL